MEKTFSALKFILHRALFQIIALFSVLILFCAFSGNSVKSEKIFQLLFFSFLITCGNLILYLKKMHLYLKIAIHFALMSVILLIILYVSGYMAASSRWPILLVGFVILYFIIATAVILIHSSRARKKSTDKSYSKIYK